MSCLDYLRLGTANILAHKRRCLTVVIIISAIVSVLTAGILIIQGTENTVYAETNRPTKGKVLLQTIIDTSTCAEKCDTEQKLTQAKSLIAEYHGEIIDAPTYQIGVTSYTALPPEILDESIVADLPQDLTQPSSKPSQDPSESPTTPTTSTLPIIISPYTAASWLQISLPLANQSASQKLKIIADIRHAALHRTISNQQSSSDQKFYVVALSPSAIGASSLGLGTVHQEGSPLNIILNQIPTGTSQTFLINSPALPAELKPASPQIASSFIWALFPNSETAYDYSQNSAFHCDDYYKYTQHCPAHYLGEINPAFGDPLSPVLSFHAIKTIYNILCAILMVIAIIVTLSTFSRLIASDAKIISLYYTAGATKRQIILIYTTYLLCLSLLASGFAILIGAVLAVIVNLLNAEALSQIFTLAFGIAPQDISIIGWNPLILLLIFTFFLTTILSIFINFRQFSAKKRKYS